jgi:hypothetical protein
MWEKFISLAFSWFVDVINSAYGAIRAVVIRRSIRVDFPSASISDFIPRHFKNNYTTLRYPFREYFPIAAIKYRFNFYCLSTEMKIIFWYFLPPFLIQRRLSHREREWNDIEIISGKIVVCIPRSFFITLIFLHALF